MCTSDCKVLKLSAVKGEYLTKLQELGAPTQDQSVHSTRFKDKLLASISGLSAYAKEREVLLVFENNIAQVLSEILEREQDFKRMFFAPAAEIVSENMFSNSDLFNGTFSQAYANNEIAVLATIYLVNMILVGSSEQSHGKEISRLLSL